MQSRLAATLVRAARQQPILRQSVRTFVAPTMPACKDAVQDIFVKELRGYKPDPSAKSADVSQVKTFTAPAAPSVPKVDEDISAAVAEYARDDATVTASAGTPAAGTQKVEYYFEEEAAPEPAH